MSDHPQVHSFESVEQALAFMAERERAANEQVTETQREITEGSYFKRVLDIPEHVVIYGYIPTMDEVERTERAYLTEDAEGEAEWEFTKQMMLDSRKRGYFFSHCYSVIVPEGEMGDVHISTMQPITKAEFDEAKRNDWIEA